MKAVIVLVFLLFVGVAGAKLSFAYADKLTIESSIKSLNEQRKLTTYSQALVTDMLVGEARKHGIDYLSADNFNVELDVANNEIIVSVNYIKPVSFAGFFSYPLSMSIGKLYLRD